MNEFELPPRKELNSRADYLEVAKNCGEQYGFTIPKFSVIPTHEFNVFKDQDGIEINLSENVPLLNTISEKISHLRGNKLIIRPIPHDEKKYPDLSFAGVYSSYIPIQEVERDEHIIRGISTVTNGRFTPYSNYYYRTHSLDNTSSRKIDILFMEFIANPAIHGTAYVHKGEVRSEHVVDPALTAVQSDPLITSVKGQDIQTSGLLTEFEKKHRTTNKVIRTLRGLESKFQEPLDVEYLFDSLGNMHVVQVRRISKPHLKNWQAMQQENIVNEDLETAIINTVGEAQGEIVDLRKKREIPNDFSFRERSTIYVVNYKDQEYIDMLDLANYMSGVRDGKQPDIIVDHGAYRRREHFAYAVMEDPHFRTIVQIRSRSQVQELTDGSDIKLKSFGNNFFFRENEKAPEGLF